VAGAGVVDQDVDAAERLGQLVDPVGRVRERRQVEAAGLGAAPAALDLARGLVRAVLVRMPGDADVEAVVRKRHGRRPADA